MNRIKKGDTVIVIAGKSKGQTGEVLKVNGDKVMVAGVNKVTKHIKPNPTTGDPGGRISKEAELHISNVMLSEDGKPVKVGFRIEEKDGKSTKVRFSKKSNSVI